MHFVLQLSQQRWPSGPVVKCVWVINPMDYIRVSNPFFIYPPRSIYRITTEPPHQKWGEISLWNHITHPLPILAFCAFILYPHRPVVFHTCNIQYMSPCKAPCLTSRSMCLSLFLKLEKNKDVITSNCIYSVSSSCTRSPHLQNIIYSLTITDYVLLLPDSIPELQLQLWRLHPKVKMRSWSSIQRASLTFPLNTCKSKNWSNTWR